MTTCQYCGETLPDSKKDTCAFCDGLIQEANCSGIYLVDSAKSISKQTELATPQSRRDALQLKFNQYTGKA